jgi:hypothetical protein
MGASDKLSAPREGLGEMTNWTGAQPLRQRNHRMTRRELMLLLGSAITAPRALRAQQKAMPVIGYLSSTSPREADGNQMAQPGVVHKIRDLL